MPRGVRRAAQRYCLARRSARAARAKWTLNVLERFVERQAPFYPFAERCLGLDVLIRHFEITCECLATHHHRGHTCFAGELLEFVRIDATQQSALASAYAHLFAHEECKPAKHPFLDDVWMCGEQLTNACGDFDVLCGIGRGFLWFSGVGHVRGRRVIELPE